MRDRLIASAGLTVVWVLLWGRPSWINVIGGFVLALIVVTVFPLPPVSYSGRIQPKPMLRLIGRFLVDLVAASTQIALLAFRFGHVPRSAVIAVPLRTPTDLTITLTSELLSLVPGSLIVEVDRAEGILYVHVLNVRTKAEAERFRETVLDLESRIIAAFGFTELPEEVIA